MAVFQPSRTEYQQVTIVIKTMFWSQVYKNFFALNLSFYLLEAAKLIIF